MKKRHFVPMIVCLSCSCLAGCKDHQIKLTYGTYLQYTTSSLKQLSNDDLYYRLFDKNETLILATFQGKYSEDCMCWSSFKNSIVNYINNYHDIIYLFDAQNINDSLRDLNIKKIDYSTPGLYIFKGRTKLADFSYDNKKDKNLFEDQKGSLLNQTIRRYVQRANMYYVDENIIKQKKENKDDFLSIYIREKCGDCQYILPNVIIPYIQQHNISKDLLIFDLQDMYDLSQNSIDNEQKEKYQNIKEELQLTDSHSDFGYLNGVVPTMQYYQKGILYDASVYFNDIISEENGQYIVSSSYYDQERIRHLKYTNTVLKGMVLNKEEVELIDNGKYHWLNSYACQHHDKIAKSFLDMYLL